MPLFILSKVVNSLWFQVSLNDIHITNLRIFLQKKLTLISQDIADSAYKVRKGQPQLFVSFSVIIADTLFSLLVQTLFLIQSMVVNLLPFNYFGIICNIHLCLLYSLYSFEYKWCNMGWELHKRLTYIENHWPYFLGFGTILTILTQLTSSITIRWNIIHSKLMTLLENLMLLYKTLCSGCIFAVFFPFTILSANEATPVTNSW